MSSSNNIQDLANREYNGLDELDLMNFLAFAKEKMKLVEMDESLMNRAVNEAFSGGEKKRNQSRTALRRRC
jgi:Fe-S cluster assembly ATP-binding protein